MYKKSWWALFIFILGIGMFCYPEEQAEAAKRTATVLADNLNVREGSGLEYSVVGQVSGGKAYPVLDSRYGWVEIQFEDDKSGWVAGYYLDVKEGTPSEKKKPSEITLKHDGTNLRSGPGTSYDIISQAGQGDRFPVTGVQSDWYKIELDNGKTAFVASWIVKKETNAHASSDSLSGTTIVIDPGHGGKDSGATGYNQTEEKKLTLKTGKMLAEKLRDAGAYVVLTRESDRFISLDDRAGLSEKYDAEAFVSLHYNASIFPGADGITSFFYSDSEDKPLAEAIQGVLSNQTVLNNRGTRFGDYFVLRENDQPAALLELGFLTSPFDQYMVSTNSYQENTTDAIVKGLVKYFSSSD